MSILPRAESKWSSSWWWDSPMNSKWLQENMKDVKIKVNAMIKLIEEDADSFARRAGMYFKKRPELMKLVEELYRAYRALAERYDHATGALRHAQQRVSEPFPNHIPLALMTLKAMEVEHSKVGLEDEIRKLQDMNSTLNEHNSECALKVTHLEAEMICLKEINCKLENEVEIHVERKKVLQQELESLKDDEIDLAHQSLAKEMEEASLLAEFLGTMVKKLQSDHDELEECCGKLEAEKLMFLDKLKDMESVSERNSALENSLSEANVELEELRERIKVLEGSCEPTNAANSTHIGENTELEELLWSLKNDLLSQVESVKQILGNLETTHASLEEKLVDLENENGSCLRTNQLKELSPLFSSVGDLISDVHQLAKLHGNPQNRSSYPQENHETSTSDHDHSTMAAGVLEIQNLIAKVQSLQILVVDTQNHLDHEKLQSAANLESARREIEELKLKESSIREEKQGMESSPNMVKNLIAKESQDEWNRMVIKRISTDANKLLALQNSAQQLKLKMERSSMSRGQNKLQFDTLRGKLKESEAVIFDLLDRNGKSMILAEMYTNLCAGEEMRGAERGEVLGKLQNGSKRIEMVELELEKIDFMFLKLEEECERTLYGRRGQKGKKRGLFCLCLRPRTLD